MTDPIDDGMQHVRVLADDIGSRPTGSAGEARAAAEPACVPPGIDADQQQRLRDYGGGGAPVW